MSDQIAENPSENAAGSGVVSRDLFDLLRPVSTEPRPDIAICAQCGWRGPASECETGRDGDWESGYYDIDLCPKCEDGGCVDDYDMSPAQLKAWEAWSNHKRSDA